MVNKVKSTKKRKDKKNEKGNTKKLFAVFFSIGTHGLKRKQNKQTNSKNERTIHNGDIIQS